MSPLLLANSARLLQHVAVNTSRCTYFEKSQQVTLTLKAARTANIDVGMVVRFNIVVLFEATCLFCMCLFMSSAGHKHDTIS